MTINRKLSIILIYTIIFALLTGCSPITSQIDAATQAKQSYEEKRFDPLNLVNEDTFRLTGRELSKKDSINMQSNPWYEIVNDYYGHAAKVYYFREGTERHNIVDEIVYYVTIEDKEEFIKVYNLLLNDMTIKWGEDYTTTTGLNYVDDNKQKSEFTDEDIRTAIDDKIHTATFTKKWGSDIYCPHITISIARTQNDTYKQYSNFNSIQISFSRK